jgi:hypothetical protein
MRMSIYCLLIAAVLVNTSNAQNVGIGTNEPANKMHIVGNIVVHAPTKEMDELKKNKHIEYEKIFFINYNVGAIKKCYFPKCRYRH